jgi:hypothetical protein
MTPGRILFALTAALLVPRGARAAESAADGVYGRLNGDLDVGLGGGAELDRSGARAALRLDAHYFSMVGAYVGYADALRTRATTVRLLGVGMDLRPAFVPRWSENLEQGPATLDLALDSIGIGLGAFFSQERDRTFGSRVGLEATLGFGVPLFGTAGGLWLGARGLLRWPETTGSRATGAVPVALLTLEWHSPVQTGLLPP